MIGLQAHWRGRMGRDTLSRLKEEFRALQASQLHAATLLQGLYRCGRRPCDGWVAAARVFPRVVFLPRLTLAPTKFMAQCH